MELISLLILGIFYFSLYSAVLWMLLFFRNYDSIFNDPKPRILPKVTIIIPAYNEEEKISNSIESCLALDYPKNKLDIIVVNDGSKDRTREICEKYVSEGKIKLINKNNGGKASAMNLGLKYAKTELVAYLDADSEYSSGALKHMVGYFQDKNVGAVTTSMKPNKNSSFIEKLQWVEYLFSIYMRKLFDFANSQYVIPGPGSIYRKDAIRACGSFDETTLTEDMEIAFKMHTTQYIIKNSANAHVTTDIPSKFRDFMKQRLRWYVGYFDNVQKFKHMIMNRKFGTLGMFLIPSNFIWFFSIIFLTGYGLFQFLKGSFYFVKNMSAINWDIINIFGRPDLTSLLYSMNTISFFAGFLMIVSVVIILFSLYVSKEEVDIRYKFTHYLIYLFAYIPIMAFIWSASATYKLLVRERSGW